MNRRNIQSLCDVDDPFFMLRIMTNYETWVYGYDLETEQESSQGKNPIIFMTDKEEAGQQLN